MKPITPYDAFDDLMAAALHGELTPEERAQFETRLKNDPAAQAAYLEAQAMHDLLERNYKSALPDPNFEQRMVSGVRRKIQNEAHRETAWESLLILWMGLKKFFVKRRAWEYAAVCAIFAMLAGVALGPITNGVKLAKHSSEMQAAHAMALGDYQAQVDAGVPNPVMKDANQLAKEEDADARHVLLDSLKKQGAQVTLQSGTLVMKSPPSTPAYYADAGGRRAILPTFAVPSSGIASTTTSGAAPVTLATAAAAAPAAPFATEKAMDSQSLAMDTAKAKSLAVLTKSGEQGVVEAVRVLPSTQASAPATTESTAPDTRKLIRNAQLDLEVKSFQATMDQITALTKAAGGYVDTSNSQRGGNGKLQGTVVVKVLPQNLDDFLLKLRDLGQVKNQSVGTEDVTKEYFDTQARLENSRRMEAQLQDLLKHENSKVADLLQVERELGRVRGEIEQMQGQLKLYDFQVQYATVTMQVREKDLNQAAAYQLKEQDEFSLFATDVEATFQKARQAADDFKAQVLAANLNHNSGSDVSAELVVMVAPDQIEPFLAQIRGLGRVANFTRQTQRVAKDGGDSDQPADQTLTEKDKVQVHLAIRSDDETRKQVALTVVAKAVDDALDQAKAAALASAGMEILSSSLNKSPQGQSTAQLTVRVPGKDYATVVAAMKALGRTASLSIQRNDNSGPGANGDDAPVIVSLSLTDDDTPLQETEMSVLASDVDSQAQQIKRDAADAGVEVKASSFERQPDGTELAQMTFRLPMSKYPAFVDTVKKLGKVESLSVRRDDRPDQTRADDTAPVEISLQMHNQRDIVADDSGLWATLRQTFGEGAAALFGSVRVIGVAIAFLIPWLFTLGLLAWIGRRIYIWKTK